MLLSVHSVKIGFHVCCDYQSVLSQQLVYYLSWSLALGIFSAVTHCVENSSSIHDQSNEGNVVVQKHIPGGLTCIKLLWLLLRAVTKVRYFPFFFSYSNRNPKCLIFEFSLPPLTCVLNRIVECLVHAHRDLYNEGLAEYVFRHQKKLPPFWFFTK